MPICPHCKVEYREGFTICANCKEALVEVPALPPEKPGNTGQRYEELAVEVPALPPEKPVKEDMIFAQQVLLYSGADDVNANILLATLKDNGIPVFLKRCGAGGYLTICTGMNAFGVDIYVPVVMLERAQKILNDITFEDGGNLVNLADECDEEFATEVNRVAQNKRMLLFAIGPGFVLLVFLLDLMLRFFSR